MAYTMSQTSSLSQALSFIPRRSPFTLSRPSLAPRSVVQSSSSSSSPSWSCSLSLGRNFTRCSQSALVAPISLSASSSCFLEGDGGRLAGFLTMGEGFSGREERGRRRKGRTGEEGGGYNPTRAAADDVPAFKGYPPMTQKPKFWWRILACVPYLMPLSETWMYAETAYSLHPFLEDYEFCTYPFLILIGSLPGWFLLAYFFGAYLGVVRNNRWPHFLRFHVVTGMLLEIIVQVIGTVNDWVPQAVYWGKFGAHYWLAVSFAFLFIVLDCIRCALNGMYADVPFLSDASYMQIPYE